MIIYVFANKREGKSTYASSIVAQSIKTGKKVYSNFSISGSLRINMSKDLGEYSFTNSVIICDEAGIEYNSRNWKALTQKAINYISMSGHYNTDIYLFAHNPTRVDVFLQEMTDEYQYLQRSNIPWIAKITTYRPLITVTDEGNWGHRIEQSGKKYVWLFPYKNMTDSNIKLMGLKEPTNIFWEREYNPKLDNVFISLMNKNIIIRTAKKCKKVIISMVKNVIKILNKDKEQ